MQLDEMAVRPCCLTLAPVTQAGEYRIVVIAVVAAQEYARVVGCRVANYGTHGRFEHIRIHSKAMLDQLCEYKRSVVFARAMLKPDGAWLFNGRGTEVVGNDQQVV
ncbi:hypothetical protein V9K90_15335 [Pseudomonas sp. CCNWLW56]|uniref:hypothetical protein n=1 Tax=Pseudomonas TaxID=286 RepID=UPI001FB6E4A9|nr:hypothetical protein [Pseudomonas fluorescens]